MEAFLILRKKFKIWVASQWANLGGHIAPINLNLVIHEMRFFYWSNILQIGKIQPLEAFLIVRKKFKILVASQWAKFGGQVTPIN